MVNNCIVSFVTINYNGYNDTCELIDSIRNNIHSYKYEIIVVDNASKDNEATKLKQKYSFIKVIFSLENLGFAGGNNISISQIEGEYVMFINNDTIIDSDILPPLIKRLNKNKIGIISPKIKFDWDRNLIQYAGFTPISQITLRNKGIGYSEIDKGQYDIAHPTGYIHGAAMALRREILEKVGLMYEGYFLYYEEFDWCERIKEKGYEIWYEPACTIYHKESRSTGVGSPLKAYYLSRNRLLFAKRNRKGVIKYLCYIYLTTVTLIRSVFTTKRNISQATLKGLMDFYKTKLFSD